jgi:hydroxyacylglutathione hydrolase
MLPHLSGFEAQGLALGQPIAQFEIGDYRNFIYLILDWDRREAAIVDPQKDLSLPLRALAEHGFKITHLLLTHTHFDHIAGVPELLRTHPELSAYVHPDDAHRLSHQRIHLLRDGEIIQIGKTQVRAIHTPGHSAGELCYFLDATQPPYLLTGDTVFIRDCGRTDLETGSNEQMFESLQRIKTLPPSTVILPGHHYVRECASTLEKEMRESPPFACKSVAELAALP